MCACSTSEAVGVRGEHGACASLKRMSSRSRPSVGIRKAPRGQGRGLFAEQAVQESGTLLLEEKAYACVVSSACCERRCHRCLGPASDAGKKLFRCGACGFALFCSRKCLEEDEFHQDECGALAQLHRANGGAKDDVLRLALRVLITAMRGRSAESSSGFARVNSLWPDDVALRTLISTTSSASSSSAAISWRAALDIGRKVVAACYADAPPGALEGTPAAAGQAGANGVGVQNIASLVLRVQCNAHNASVFDKRQTSVISSESVSDQEKSLHLLAAAGLAIFPRAAALANHSCDPNACYFAEALEQKEKTKSSALPTLRLRSLRALEKGEEVTISYSSMGPGAPGSLPALARERRASILSSHGFQCRCDACEREAAREESFARGRTRDLERTSGTEGSAGAARMIAKAVEGAAELSAVLEPLRGAAGPLHKTAETAQKTRASVVTSASSSAAASSVHGRVVELLAGEQSRPGTPVGAALALAVDAAKDGHEAALCHAAAEDACLMLLLGATNAGDDGAWLAASCGLVRLAVVGEERRSRSRAGGKERGRKKGSGNWAPFTPPSLSSAAFFSQLAQRLEVGDLEAVERRFSAALFSGFELAKHLGISRDDSGDLATAMRCAAHRGTAIHLGRMHAKTLETLREMLN